jgi:hypothetical protein
MPVRTLVAAAEPPEPTGGALARVLVGVLPNSWLRSRATVVPITAPTNGPFYREMHRRTPLDVRMDDAWWCPMCDHMLVLGPRGWRCVRSSCRASWDYQGRNGRWEVSQ